MLTPGGVLAAFWNRAVWARAPLREPVLEAYRQAAPEILAETDPIHPGSSVPADDEDWRRAISATGGLGAGEVRNYEWSMTYSAGDYAALLDTHSTIRVLRSERRAALLGAVARAIESHGGQLTLPFLTRLCLARRDTSP